MNEARVLEIIEAHTGYEFDVNGLIWEDFEPKDKNVTFMDGYRGCEGGGEEAWVVYKIVDGDEIAYIHFSGNYNSWDGTDWDEDFEFVYPKEETVIKYYKVK